MKQLFTLLIIILPAMAMCQSYDDLTPDQKHYVDSLVQRKEQIANCKTHHMMVSFSEGKPSELQPFFDYLVNKLHYKFNGKELSVVATKTGYVAKFFKNSTGYNQTAMPLVINLTTDKTTGELKSATLVGGLNLLSEIYLRYFEGPVQPDTPEKGGLDKTYTATDEVRLYTDRITIQSHHNTFSSN